MVPYSRKTEPEARDLGKIFAMSGKIVANCRNRAHRHCAARANLLNGGA
jgi:hypothetical protein